MCLREEECLMMEQMSICKIETYIERERVEDTTSKPFSGTQPVAIPKKEYGKFNDGDSYIVLLTRKSGR